MRHEHLPPFDRYRIELRLAQPVSFPFEHGGILRGLLSRALRQHRFPTGLIPFPCESGRVRFDAGEPYALGVTFAGPDRAHAEDLIAGLERLGAARPQGPAPVLGGNFVVERAERLEPPDLDADVEALRQAPEIGFRFVSPLRLERPPDLKRRGAGFLNRDCFPVPYFLDRLWRHLYHLTHHRYCDDEERTRLQPPLPETAGASGDRLLWSDLPVRGNPRRKPFTLGGVRGRVTWTGIAPETADDAWLAVLAAGSYLHAGTKTAYGFGRYTLAGTSSAADPLLPPGRSLLDRVAKPLRFESEQFFDRSRRQIVGIVVLFRAFGNVELAEKGRSRSGLTFATGCSTRKRHLKASLPADFGRSSETSLQVATCQEVAAGGV